jgi:hypothetical protein
MSEAKREAQATEPTAPRLHIGVGDTAGTRTNRKTGKVSNWESMELVWGEDPKVPTGELTGQRLDFWGEFCSLLDALEADPSRIPSIRAAIRNRYITLAAKQNGSTGTKRVTATVAC